MKLIARIFVVMRKDKAPTLVSTSQYVKQLTRVDPTMKVFQFLRSEDASVFISNYNLQMNESKKQILINETEIRQRVENDLNDRVKIYKNKLQEGFSIKKESRQNFYVGFKDGEDFPQVYKSKQALIKMNYPEDKITNFSNKVDAQQFVIDVLKQKTEAAKQYQDHMQTQMVDADHEEEISSNLEEGIIHIPDQPMDQAQYEQLTAQQKEQMETRFNKLIELNLEYKTLFRWYHLKLRRVANPDLQYRLFFDGSTQMKVGQTNSAAGIVIYEGEKRFFRIGIFVGSAKSNGAEFHGLLYGIRAALEHGITNLDVFGDSELIIKFMKGQYKVKDEVLKVLFDCAKKYENLFDSITYTQIPRTMNEEADIVANKSREQFIRYVTAKRLKAGSQ